MFSSSRVGLLLYLAHAAASVCIGLLFRFYRGDGTERRRGAARSARQTKPATLAFTSSVRDSFMAILNICAFVLFFTVVIRMLFLTGILPGLAAGLGVLFSPLGFSSQMAEQLLTGVIELSSGVWSLTAAGSLTGRLSMAAFMLGWAGLSVHCQVLSFVGSSGLSVRTYLVGKLLHGGLSAVLIALLVRVFPLAEPVDAYLTEQVASLAELDFFRALTTASATAFLAGLCFVAIALWSRKKYTVKKRWNLL